MKGVIYSVAIATVIFSLKITCYFHMWRYHVFVRKLTWNCIGVEKISDRIQSKWLLQKEDIHLGTVTVKGADWNGVMEAARRIFVVSKGISTRIQWNTGLWLQCFHDNIVITTKCLTTSLKGLCHGCPVQFVDISKNASLCAMKLNVTEKILVNDSQHY